ncbi:MAG: PAS domain S-box protein, partial [Rhizobiales bacterium]|nr:PAS domain S-box protein [Hyphomicrobiales bacterium]
GELIGAVVSFRDITERQNTESALLESEERYRKIVDATHDIMFLMSADDGTILDFDDEACRLLNYTRSELLAKTAYDLHAHELTAHAEQLRQLFETGRMRTEKLSCLSSNGVQIPVRISASMIQLKGQNCVLAMVQDLTDNIQAEKQARKLQSDLHHVSRLSAMGEMASGMAHELNQPLTAVMNYLQACQLIFQSDNKEQQAKIPEYMTKAIDQAERAGKIISGLRTFVEKGEAIRTLENLNEIVEEASGLLFTRAVSDNIKFEMDLAKNLPRIRVDKIQIQQVIFNLVRNGMEALADTENARISICTSLLDDSKLKVSIRDNGPGVDSDIQEKLFDAFTTSKADGMGVGLSICKSIVEDHCGMIRADRNEDAGMTFSFTLAGDAEENFDG